MYDYVGRVYYHCSFPMQKGPFWRAVLHMHALPEVAAGRGDCASIRAVSSSHLTVPGFLITTDSGGTSLPHTLTKM